MPKKSIFITAVAGTGKSTLCKELNRLGYKSYDIESIPDLFTLYDHKTGGLMPNHDNSDLELVKRGNWHCDKEKLRKIIKDETAPLTFYCGAATNAKEIADLFDKIIVLSVSDSTTLKRLGSRKVGDFAHTKEVQELVLSWKNKEDKLGGIKVDAEGTPNEIALKVISKTL